MRVVHPCEIVSENESHCPSEGPCWNFPNCNEIYRTIGKINNVEETNSVLTINQAFFSCLIIMLL